MVNIIDKHLVEIKRLMLHYGIQHAYAFGSAVKGTMTEDSDVDFVIRFPEKMDYVLYADNYFALMRELEKLLGKNVELVAEETLHNPFLIQSINEHKMQLL